jgi:RuvA, C-terminal domain
MHPIGWVFCGVSADGEKIVSLKIATKTTVWFLILAGAVLLFDFIATMHGLLFVAAITAVISGWLLLYQIVAGIELRRPMVRPVVVEAKRHRVRARGSWRRKPQPVSDVPEYIDSCPTTCLPVPSYAPQPGGPAQWSPTPQIAKGAQPKATPSMHAIAEAATTGGGPVKADAISVLCNLGYTKSDARRSVAMVQIENPHAELDELVRNALALLVSPLVVNQSAAVN